jgi:hypothetical protein
LSIVGGALALYHSERIWAAAGRSDYDKRFVVVVYGVTCNVCLRCDKVPGRIRASAVFAELRELYAEQRTLYALVWRAMSVGSNNFPCGHNNDFVVVVAE